MAIRAATCTGRPYACSEVAVYLSERDQEGGFGAQRAGAVLPRHAGLSGRWLLNGCPASTPLPAGHLAAAYCR